MRRCVCLVFICQGIRSEEWRRGKKDTFCLAGHGTRFGKYRICCPEECGVCSEKICLSTKKAMACCPVSGILAFGRECRRRKEVGCYWRSSLYDPEAVSSVDSQFPRLGYKKKVEKIRSQGDIVNIAMAADRVAWLGLIGAVGSLFNAAKEPDRLRVFIILDTEISAKAKNGLDIALRCASQKKGEIRFVKFDAKQALGKIKLRAPEGPAYGNLKTPLNFARFFLSELLPQAIHRVLYLDADVIIQRDVADLLDEIGLKRHDFAVAAVPRPQIKACYDQNASRPGMFFCQDQAFKEAGIRNPDADLFAFNAGVAVLDLNYWRRHELIQTILFWLRQHEKRPLWRLGSNPPLVLAAFQAFEPIDHRWNCDGLGWKRPYNLDCLQTDAFIWHWSGGRKPWLRGGLYQRIWWHNGLADARCLTALHDTPVPFSDDDLYQTQILSPSQPVLRQPSPHDNHTLALSTSLQRRQ